MSETEASGGAGSLIYDLYEFGEMVNDSEEWSAFYLEWSDFTATHSCDSNAPPGTVGTNTLTAQQVDNPLLGDVLGDDFLPAWDFEIMESPQNLLVSPMLPQPQRPQPYSQTRHDDGTQPSAWHTPPLIPSSEASPHSSSDAKSQQPSSAQNVHYSCNYCLKSFAKRHDLNRHTKLHTKPEACPVGGCQYRTAKRKEINRHLVAKHPEQGVTQPLLAAPRVRCAVPGCGFVQEGVRRKDNLKRHMRNKHAREVT